MSLPTKVTAFGERSKRFTQLWIGGLLLLAVTHVILSYFFANFSWIDLDAYERGTERNPYQSRVAMVLVLRAAHRSLIMQHLAAAVQGKLGGHQHSPFRQASPETLACMFAALLSGYLLIVFLYWYGAKKLGSLGWIPPLITLGILSVTMCARYEASVWYPYDFPHIFFFGTCALCILEGWWPAAVVLFLLDVPMRETAIFLLPLWIAVTWGRRRHVTTAWEVGLLFAVWIAFRVAIHHHFSHNPSDVGSPSNLGFLENPIHWPQLGSAFGFLLLPFISGFQRLSRIEQAFALGALPGLLITLIYGIWAETRIFSEWIPPFAVLLSQEAISFVQSSKGPFTVRPTCRQVAHRAVLYEDHQA